MHSVRSPRSAATVVAAAFALAVPACDAGVQAPSGPPAIEGVIVEVGRELPLVEPPASSDLLVWIKENRDDECGIVFFVRRSTQVLVGDRRANREEIRVGHRARAWTGDEPIAESCPAQGVARGLQLIVG